MASSSANSPIYFPRLCLTRAIYYWTQPIYIYIYIYKQAYAQWQAGATLAELVEEHDFAPTALLRLILQEDGCSRGQIKKGLREPSRYFPGRKDIAEAVKSASETDGFSWIECGFHRPAKEWEDAVVKHFQTRLGLDLVTEAELNVFQRHLFGRQVATPDLLLKTPVRINGQEVNWVDAKHVYFSSKCKLYARLSSFLFLFHIRSFFWGGEGRTLSSGRPGWWSAPWRALSRPLDRGCCCQA